MSTPSETPPSGDWLFQLRGMLYGPIPARLLLEKVEKGELDGETPVARDGEAFRRLADEPVFAVQVARAAARLRVEAQARADAARRRRRRLAWGLGIGAAALLFAGGAVRLVWWAQEAGYFAPDASTLAALEIHAAVPTIELRPMGERPQEELLEYLEAEEKRGAAAPRAPRKAGAAAQGRAEPDGLVVEAQYDPAAIQAVLSREQRGLYPCLQQEAGRDPTFRGEVPLAFTLDNDGRVGRVWIDRPGLEQGPLESCFRAQMARWRFPAFAGERPSIRLSFRVGG